MSASPTGVRRYSTERPDLALAGLGVGGAILAVVPARWLLLAAAGALTANAALTRLGLRPRAAPQTPRSAEHERGRRRRLRSVRPAC